MDINAASMALGGLSSERPKPSSEGAPQVRTAYSGAKPQLRSVPEAPVKPEQAVAPEALERKVEAFNKGLQSLSQTKVRFRVDPGLEELLVSVVDTDTDEIVRQIPSEEMVEIAQRMREIQGILLDRKV